MMTFDEWIKSPGRNERLVKIEIQPGIEIEAICRVNSKRDFFAKLEILEPSNAESWELFSGEWFNPQDHARRLFRDADAMESQLSPEMIDKFMEAWTFANTGKKLPGELMAPGMLPEPRSVSHGGALARHSASLISTIWSRLFPSRR